MPRDGSNIYHRPTGTDAVTDTTIESSKYNSNVADVEQDLNTPRPIVAGGTGATSAAAALTALGGEQAKQIITNFDANVFVPGSFYAATTATASPVAGHAFAGIAYAADASNMVIECRDLTDAAHIGYTRIMTASVWGAFAVSNTATFVKKAGDTMTGNLVIDTPSGPASLGLDKTAGTNTSQVYGSVGNLPRWSAMFGDTTAEGGGNVGSNFAIVRYNDAGSQIGVSLMIDRSTGLATVEANPTALLGIVTKQYADAIATSAGLCVLRAGDTMTGALTATALTASTGNITATLGNITASAGNITASAGNITAIKSGAATQGTYLFGNTGTKTLTYDGTGFVLTGGGLSTSGVAANGGNVRAAFTATVGTYEFGTSSLKYLTYDAIGNYILVGSPAFILQPSSGSSVATFFSNSGGAILSGVGTNSSSINVYSNAGGSQGMFCVLGASAWSAISDARLPYKRSARKLSALDKLRHVQLYENVVDGRLELFGIAQEIHEAFPHIVKVGSGGEDYVPDGMQDEKAWAVTYDRMGIIALQAAKELLEKVAHLEAEIALLKAT